MRLIDADELLKRLSYGTADTDADKAWIATMRRMIKEQPTCDAVDVQQWIPANMPPENDRYILLSFANFSVPLVGRYDVDEDDGAYYVGDEAESCISQGVVVNGWQELPEPYRKET